MKIYSDNVVSWRKRAPRRKKGMKLPCVVMERDNWDDYSYTTSYLASIFDQQGNLVHDGSVKILQRDSKSTKIPDEFESLGDKYCSLWQSVKDYEAINKLDFGHDILSSLNDIIYDEVIRDKFKDHPGLRDSLRRFSEAEQAFQLGAKILTNSEDLSSFSFSYDEGETSGTPFGTVYFKFSRKLLGLYRVIGIIGRNGVGKTTLLANLARSLSGIKKTHTKLSPRPPFSKVIAVSYSTFDDFYRPSKEERTFSYFYCGIRDSENELLSKTKIHELFQNGYKSIVQSNKLEVWEKCMNILYLGRFDSYFPDRSKIMASFRSLSSGQKIMTLSFTQIVNTIEPNSVLLFDEPETHLHPNGQNTLFKCLDNLLQQFDSFAIISTHSPIFIQNIPSNNVLKLMSVDTVRSVQPLTIESFGQHFSKLTEEIFGFSENNLFYVEKLRQLYDTRGTLENEYDDLNTIDSIGARYHLKNFEND
jgi:predicted ATPase